MPPSSGAEPGVVLRVGDRLLVNKEGALAAWRDSSWCSFSGAGLGREHFSRAYLHKGGRRVGAEQASGGPAGRLVVQHPAGMTHVVVGDWRPA
jgi:hypothetical protein